MARIRNHFHFIIYRHVCIVSGAQLLSGIRLFAILWTVACQALLSVEFSRQEYWSGLLFSPPGDLPDPAHRVAFEEPDLVIPLGISEPGLQRQKR